MTSASGLVLPFRAPEAERLDLAGGKGASLAKAARSLPVPPGIIVSSAAYREFVRPLQTEIAALLARHAGDHAAMSAQVQARIAVQPLPAALLAELEAVLRAEDLLDRPVAVRSSGTLEDLPGAAFAGQHDTFLNRRGLDDIADAVRRCYVSMWNEWVLPYRERLGVAHLEAAMAVVVQRLVRVSADEAAGVAFSVDPVRGRLDTVLINAAYGLGETVVGGESPVDEFRVARGPADDGTLPRVDSQIADKPEALVAGELGTERVAIDASRRQLPALDAAACAEVARLALAAEHHFGFPQDIEWAWQAGRLYLLQSRPVTRIPPRWTRDESAERFPNVVTPMTWDLVEEGFHTSLNYSFSLMGLPSFNDKWFAVRDCYIYGNQNAVDLYSGRLPTGMLKDLPTLLAALPEIARRYAWVQDLPVRWMRDLDTYLLGIGALMGEPLAGKTVAELWDYVLRVRDLGRAYFLPNIAISLTQRSLYLLLRQLIHMVMRGADAEVQATFDRLLAATDTKTGQVNRELWELARIARRLPDSASWLATIGGRAWWSRLDDYPEFARVFRRFLEQHGHREVDFDAYHPTWIEAPHIVLDQIKILATQPDEDEREHERAMKRAMAETEHALLTVTPAELRYLMQEVIRLARAYTALDDLEHYQTTRLTLPFRRGLASLGQQLVAEGVLAESGDIYFCPVAIFDAAVASGDFATVGGAVAAHKAAYAVARTRTPDWEYGIGNVIDLDAIVLCGLGGSPGCAEGQVFVVRGPEDFADFPVDAILVARTTNPAWTPLFYRAKGVITESGGPLSHGAVTARELNLPAVMSVRHVMERLTSGMRVRIDGGQGMVQVLAVAAPSPAGT
jgi:rifampicin phosphotransferase